jgi:hypothetical protein
LIILSPLTIGMNDLDKYYVIVQVPTDSYLKVNNFIIASENNRSLKFSASFKERDSKIRGYNKFYIGKLSKHSALKF